MNHESPRETISNQTSEARHVR